MSFTFLEYLSKKLSIGLILYSFDELLNKVDILFFIVAMILGLSFSVNIIFTVIVSTFGYVVHPFSGIVSSSDHVYSNLDNSSFTTIVSLKVDLSNA